MATIAKRRISEVEVETFSTTNVVEIPDAIKGFHVDLFPKDIVTFGDLFLTTLRESVFSDEGDDFAKGCFWVSESEIQRGNLTIKGQDVPAGIFTRCAQARSYPSLGTSYKDATSSVEKPILYGEELFQTMMEELKLLKGLRELNYELARACASRSKLASVKTRKFEVMAAKTAYVLRFNSKQREDWGTRPGDWRSTKILFFKELKA